MVKINDTTTFPNTAPALGDHFPGTDVSNTGTDAAGETVTFTLQAVMDLFEANMTVPSSVSSAYRTSTILSSTSNGEGASLIGIEDAAANFTATTVEGALAEIISDLASTSNGLGASTIGVEDAAANFTATTVEGVLAELAGAASSLNELSDVTLTTAAQGDVLYRNATGWVNLGAGTSGQFLQTQGAGANPQWATPTGSGNVSNSGTPANNQFAVWTDSTTIEGISALTYDATDFEISAALIPNADGTVALGSSANRFSSIHVDSIDLNGTTFSGTTLADPGVDAGLFWDDSASSTAYFTAGTGLEFSTTNLQIDSTVVQNTGATFSGLVNFSGTNHAGLRLITLTTTQRNALTPAAGDVIYNSTTGNIEGYDGASWLDLGAGSAGGIASVVEDTTPQLGGDLDVNGQAIVSAAGGNIPITPDTTGNIILDGLTWPNADGAANTALTTDGAGTLSFVNLSTRTETFISKTIDSANNTLTLDMSEGTLTGTLAQFNTALSDGNFTGQQHLYIPAAAMIARTTSGAAAGSTELATNDVMVESFDFDTAADEHVQFSLQMPKNWNEGTLVAQFIWSHPSTTTNFGVTWAIQAVAFADGDAGDTAFGTAVLVDDTGGTTDDIYISPESGAITVAGTPGAEEYVVFQVYRDVSDVNDDLAVDARLHGVKIHWTSDAITAD